MLSSSKVLSKLILQNFSRNFSQNSLIKTCVVGSGPAGFYASQYLLKHLSNCQIDLIEKLPVPFGLGEYFQINFHLI